MASVVIQHILLKNLPKGLDVPQEYPIFVVKQQNNSDMVYDYKQKKETGYEDTLEIRLKYQRDFHVVEFFDGVRLNDETIPEGKYAYQTRHSDTDWARPVTIVPLGKKVLVNFCGTIVSDQPLNVRGDEDKLTYVSWL